MRKKDKPRPNFGRSVLYALTARAAAERIKLRLKRTVEDIIEIGRELTAVKEYLPHGQFLPWIATEFEMSDRTANDFMNVAIRFGGKSAIISDLKPTILYALSAPSTPESVIDKAVAKRVAAHVPAQLPLQPKYTLRCKFAAKVATHVPAQHALQQDFLRISEDDKVRIATHVPAQLPLRPHIPLSGC